LVWSVKPIEAIRWVLPRRRGRYLICIWAAAGDNRSCTISQRRPSTSLPKLEKPTVIIRRLLRVLRVLRVLLVQHVTIML